MSTTQNNGTMTAELKAAVITLWHVLACTFHDFRGVVKPNPAGAFLGYGDVEWSYPGIPGSSIRIRNLEVKVFLKAVIPQTVIDRLLALQDATQAGLALLGTSLVDSAVDFAVGFPTKEGRDANGNKIPDRNRPGKWAYFPVVQPGQDGTPLRHVLAAHARADKRVQELFASNQDLIGHLGQLVLAKIKGIEVPVPPPAAVATATATPFEV